MQLSVVIPCRNEAETIGNQLAALSRQKWSQPWEVIVADNGSTDGTLQIVEQYREKLPCLRIVDASDQRGAAHARNVGVRTAKAEAIAFCDADDEVGSGWLAAIHDGLRRNDFVACRVDLEKLNRPEIIRIMKNPQGKGLQRVSYPPYLAHAGGSSLGVKRSVHERVGGFDESLLALEDTDYCFRIQLHGVELHFLPDAIIHYRYRNHLSGLFRQSRLWAEYNVLMYKRYRQEMRVARPWRRYLRIWKTLVRNAPRVVNKERRAGWVRTLGTQIGLLQGAIKHRVPPGILGLFCLGADRFEHFERLAHRFL